MKIHSTPLIRKQNFLKLIALISAYLIWRVISNYHLTTLTLQAPLSFYNISTYAIDAPESITVTLQGHKKSFIHLAQNLALHINVAQLHEGENQITVSSENLFLPDGLKLVRWSPYYFTITLKKN